MTVEKLRDLFSKTRREDPFEPREAGWQKFLKQAESVENPGESYAEFQPESRRLRRNPFRIALLAGLMALVLSLLVVVSTEMMPVLRDLPSPVDRFRAALAEFSLTTPERKPASMPATAATRTRKRHAPNGQASETALKPLPPYKGVVRAEIMVTPLTALRPFRIEVRDGSTHRKLEVEPRQVEVDIDEPEPAVVQATSPPKSAEPPPAAFAFQMDLSGPEADRVANVLQPEWGESPELSARRYRRNPEVGLLTIIDRRGMVSSIRRVNGSSALAQAAIDTVRRTQYQPFYRSGKPVEMQVFVNVSFTIPEM